MKLTTTNIRKNTTGTKGNYSVRMFFIEEQTTIEFNSKDGYLQMITEEDQKCGHRDFETVGGYVYNKKDFVDEVKAKLEGTKETDFI